MINTIFNLNKKPERPKFNQEQAKSEFPCVVPNDLYPVNLIAPDMEHGPWIAGGAALAWYQRQPVGFSDIDVFCKNEEQANQLIDKLSQKEQNTLNLLGVDLSDVFSNIINSSVVYRSNNATTIRFSDPEDSLKVWTIQVITKHYFDSLADVINTFDITVCQLGTDGKEFLLNNNVAKHIRNKELHFRKPYQPDIVKRLVKYWSYGYEPEPNLIEEITSREVDQVKWTFKREEEEYENAFNIR